jgi:superfamily I DNA/RNA helicase
VQLKKELNPQQYAAVTHKNGPILVLAGAGSGKTKAITYRIAYLIHHQKVDPKTILGVTFTNKAAGEMRQRVAALIGPKAKEVTLCTFHSLGLKILREHGHHLGYRRNFTIYGEGDQLSLLRTLIREHPKKRDKFDAGILLSRISGYKNKCVDGKSEFPLYGDKYDDILPEVYDRFQSALRAYQAVDFDDLILLPIRLLDEFPDVRRFYHETYQHLLVDEYQDTNHGQYRLITLLASAHRNICVVGDDDQSIYGWRGAEVRNILNFEKDYPDAKVIKLEQNYRSTQVILDAANHVIKNNNKRQDKRLWTDRGRGKNIDAFLARDENDEAKTIAWRLQTIKERASARWSDFAVLYRSNVQSRALESTFRVNKIPYIVVGGYEFFDRKEVKDIIAYLKVVQNPRDDLSLLRILNYPRRGIGDSAIVRLHEEAHKRDLCVYDLLKEAQNDHELSKQAQEGLRSFLLLIEELRKQRHAGDLSQLVRSTIEKTGYREEIERTIDDAITAQMKIDTVEELVSAASSFSEQEEAGTLASFLDSLSLNDDTFQNGGKKIRPDDAVLLATLHSAKGLEFPYVFMCGMEEDLLPHSRSLNEGGGIDEERRLCYVGITRARRHLTMSLVQERNKFGRKAKRIPSRFLKEIPEDLLCKQYSHSPNFFDRQIIKSANDDK